MKLPVEPIQCSCCGASPEILMLGLRYTCICPECGNSSGESFSSADDAITEWNHKNEQQYADDLDDWDNNTDDDWKAQWT